ncbi:MAG: preprotein translocase subunit SecE, partial [Lachnospiraceae bacterium]|nr:preprotein translocase subunit SecE [Lachnospiraceae bacterium]
MFRRKWYEWILTIVFFLMVALCVYLNLSPDHKESITTITVNAVMFVIVAIVFLMADFGSFAPMNAII